MKNNFSDIIAVFFRSEGKTYNAHFLMRFCVALLALIALYTLLFYAVMLHEGRDFTLLTGLYWTLTTMSTLGYGDVTFHSSLGHFFSIIVLLSGMVLFLIMLPFVFIQFFYVPWLERQKEARAPRSVPATLNRHVIFTHFGHVTANLIAKLRQYGTEHIIITPNLSQALELHDRGFRVLLGELDDPETYLRARAEYAAMVVVLNDDVVATNIIFTVREAAPEVIIAANASLDDSVDIFKLAGATHVFQFTRLLGKSLARRVLGVSMASNIIGEFGRLRIAETPVMGTWILGKTIAETKLREMVGVNIVGLWQEGKFQLPTADTTVTESTVLILAGTMEQLQRFDQSILLASGKNEQQHPVLILGGGQVGQAVCANFEARNIDYRIVEQSNILEQNSRVIHGSAADLEVLERAGVRSTPSILVTTHDDDLNIYLTIYCRRLRPDAQIISRASFDRNINTLHRAGANLVMSYSSLVATTITNLLKPEQVLMLSEGLNIFRALVNTQLAGKGLAELKFRRDIGCSVVAIKRGEHIDINPNPATPLTKGDELMLIGSTESEKRYHELYPPEPLAELAENSPDADEMASFGDEGEVTGHGAGVKR